MKTYKPTSFYVLSVLLAAPLALSAATVNIDTTQHGSRNPGTVEISVFDGNSYINGDVNSTALTDVIDYAFFSTDPNSAALAGSSTVIPTSVTSAGSGSNRQAIDFYTTDDPAGLTPTATFNQFEVGTGNSLTGTVDFSALPGGTGNDVNLYFIHGGWFEFDSFSISDGTDTFNHVIPNGSDRELEWVTTATISGFTLSDTWTYTFSGAPNNPTFVGVIATQAVPEPSAFALIAGMLGMLCVMVRRRN